MSIESAENAYHTITDPKGALSDALFDGVFGDFITFFNNILVGKNPGDDNDKCFSVIRSNNSISTAQNSISDIFNEHKENIDQSVYIDQDITINCGEAELQDYQFEKEYDYNIFGQKTGPGCIKYGCCYDIEQIATSSVHAINSDITKRKEEMYDKITSSIKNDVHVDVGGKCNIGVLNNAIEASRSDAVEEIQSILDEAIKINTDDRQGIIIKSMSPLRCVNDCDEPPSAGKIKQNINIDIHSQNIVNSTYEKIIKNYKDMNISSKVDIDAVPKGRLYLFSILSLVIISIIYLLLVLMGKGIAFYFFKTKCLKPIMEGGVPCGVISHTIAVISIFILYFIYSTFVCSWRDMSNPFCFL